MRKRIAVVVTLAGLAQACGHAPTEPGAVTSLVFLTQTAAPDATMTALFTGRIDADAAGCLRLSSSGETVIWPKGFTSVIRDDDVLVLDADGRVVGQLGGTFRLGGGVVPSLHAGIPVAPADLLRASTSCPGEYWVVGSVVR